MSSLYKKLAACLAMLAANQAPAALNDVFPGDFHALPEGRSTLTSYLYDREQSGTWLKGRRLGDLQVDSAIYALRYTRYFMLGKWKVAPVLVASAAGLELSGASVPGFVDRRRSGMGDPRIGATVWLIDDPANNHFLAINLMTVWPEGRYDGKEIANSGENRRRQALMLGWTKELGKGVIVDLVPEIAWYDRNLEGFPGKSSVSQERTLSLTTYLRYRITPQWQAFAGAVFNEGGATRVNRNDNDNPVHGRRAMFGAAYRVDNRNLINARLARDVALSSGLKTEHELTLRWVHMF